MYGKTIPLLCMFGPQFLINFLWRVCITSWNNVTLLLILFRNFTYLFKWFRFLVTSELHWIMEIVETCELRMEVTLHNGHILLTLFFKLSNFLIMLIFLIMLRLLLLWYVCIKYGNNVTVTFHICSAEWQIHNYNITCFDTITNFKWH